MARKNLTIQDLGQFGAATPSLVTLNAADDVMFANDGLTLLLVDNGAATVVNPIVVSVKDQFGRTGDITLAVNALSRALFGPFTAAVFNQKTGADIGKIYINFDVDSNVKIVPIRLTI